MGMVWVAHRRPYDEAAALVASPESVESLLESDDDGTSVDLDKAWHGLHWLLTGSADPTDDVASEAILGGDPAGEDLGYGPARLLAPERVQLVAAALQGMGRDALRQRVDLNAMAGAGLYPDIWDEDDVFDAYLAPAYERLRSFYVDASRTGQAVIQIIC